MSLKLKINYNLHRIFIGLFLLFFIGQFIFWHKTENIKPDIHVVPPLPSKHSVAALSFGDPQFYFRVKALAIENAGDSFGRFSALRDYDYALLYQWFKMLDGLDDKSSYIPSLAATYYSQTQNPYDTKYLIKYLEEYSSRDVDKYWWWMFQAFFMANNSLKDHEWALKLAKKLSLNENVDAPEWSRQLPAFVYKKMGKDCDAFLFVKKIIDDNDSGKKVIAAKEMDFMRLFIKETLERLKEKNFDPKSCK